MNARPLAFAPILALASLAAACGGSAPPAVLSVPTPTPVAGSTAAAPSAPEAGGVTPSGAAVNAPAAVAPPAPAALFESMRGDLTRCYANGKRGTPTMTDGRITLEFTVDDDGKTTCVVPSDDRGLTQEVEDCMSARVAKETYPTRTSWSSEIPVVVHDGAVALGESSAAPTLETVESHGIDGAGSGVQAVMPELRKCTQELPPHGTLRVVHVGARIARDGKPQCAVASSDTPVPASVRKCVADAMMGARFSPTKAASAFVSVPLKVMGGR